MKRSLSLFSVVLLASALHAADPRSISVNGEGKVDIEPDQIVLHFTIETSDKNLSKAKDANIERTKNVLAAFKKLDIPSKDIQTRYVQINPRYEYPNGRSVFMDYSVSKQFEVLLRKLDDYGKVLNAVVDAGVTQMSGGQFSSSKEKELRAEARKRAIQNAKEKATAMAAELNQKIGLPLQIEEAGGQGPVMPMQALAWRAKSVSAEDSISPGEMTIQSNVMVRFELQ